MAKAARLPAATPTGARPWMWLGVAIIVVMTFIAYWPAINAGYIWDDDSYVTENPLVQQADGLWKLWVPKQTPQYYPAVFTTFWIEHQVWGLDPMGFHIVNVLLHIANALLVWRLCAMLKVPGAWLIGAVFALHPIHVESVAWITERKNVLSGFFYFASAVMYLKFDDGWERGEDASVVWRRYAISLVLFVLALLSKTVTCSLPAALILMMLWQRKSMTLPRVTPLIPFFIVGLALALNTAAIEREYVGAEGVNFAFSIADRVLIASKALLFYPWKILWPHPLMFIYPRWVIDPSNVASYWSVAAVMFIGAAALWSFLRGKRGPGLALAFFAGTIFPALGFVNAYPMLFSFVADHFVYLASLGIITLATASLAVAFKTSQRLAVVATVVLPVLGVLTWRQATHYENAEALWRDTLHKNETSWMPHNNLANQLIRRSAKLKEAGDHTGADRLLDEAFVHIQRAMELRSNYREAMSNMASLLLMRKQYEDALVYAKAALKDIENYQDPIIARRIAEGKIVNPVSPPRASAIWEVARLQELLARESDAMASYIDARRWNPRDPVIQKETFRFLREHGKEALKAGRNADANRMFRELYVQSEGDEQLIDAGYWLTHFLTTCPDASLRNGQEAVRVGEELVQRAARVQRESPFLLGVLASAYAQAGRFDDAVRTGEQAVALARRLNEADLAAELERQLAQYRQRRPSQ